MYAGILRSPKMLALAAFRGHPCCQFYHRLTEGANPAHARLAARRGRRLGSALGDAEQINDSFAYTTNRNQMRDSPGPAIPKLPGSRFDNEPVIPYTGQCVLSGSSCEAIPVPDKEVT